ncbi:MAG: DUF5658 family protein [Clostridium sp.]
MNSNIKNITLPKIIRKFKWICALNVTDILFTLLLLRTGCYVEVNGLINLIVGNPFFASFVKIVIPAVLLFLIAIRMRKATFNQLRVSNWLTNGILIFYVGINISHLIWIGMLPLLLGYM